MPKLSIAGKSVPRLDSLEKVTGKAKFCSDFYMRGMLYAKILRSPYPHANILSIDTSKAEKLPGVRAVATGKDAPHVRVGFIILDEYILCHDGRTRAIGEAVAAVAADTIEIAQDAIDLIDVEYEELPPILSAEDAMKENPPSVIHPDRNEYVIADPSVLVHKEKLPPNVCYHDTLINGDIEKGFKSADFIIENRYTTPRISHATLETTQCDAWTEPDGTLCIRSSTQSPWINHGFICDAFKLPPTKVRLLTPYVGGMFGGKTANSIELIAALLTMKSGKPVRLVLSREEQFIDGHQRTPIITYVKDGVKKDGTLIARQIMTITDCGRHGKGGLITGVRAGFIALQAYKIPNFRLDSYAVWTNQPITSPFRGIGSPEVNWAIEQQMDIIAETVGIDPVELRRKHLFKKGETDISGSEIISTGAKECLDKVAQWIEWDKKPANQQGPWKRGKGIACGNKLTSAGFYSVAQVKVHKEGIIEVRHGGIEAGQGLNTILAQIAAEEFNTTIEKIKIVCGDTNFCPYDWQVASSRSTLHLGNAVKRACIDAKSQVLDIASGILGINASELEVKDGVVYAPTIRGRAIPFSKLFVAQPIARVALKKGEIMGSDWFVCHMEPRDPNTGRTSRLNASYSHGANAVEVAVNIDTGEIRILRIAAAFDPGFPINPKMVDGQIEGGVVMGIGASLYEEIVMENGIVINPNFIDYKIPTTMESPTCDNLKPLTVLAPHREGVYGSKGVGEATLCPTAPAIGNAIYNAVGVRINELPLTREKIWKALNEVKKVSVK